MRINNTILNHVPRRATVTALVTLGLLSLALLSGLAQPATTQDSTGFPFKYEMFVLPDTQDLDTNGTGDWQDANIAITESATTGIATISNPSLFNSDFNNSISRGKIATGGDYTIEVRLKITSGTNEGSSGTMAIYYRAQGGTRIDALTLGTNTLKWTQANGTLMFLAYVDNTDDFHTYRITRSGGSSPWAYRDNVLLNSLVGGGALPEYAAGSSSATGFRVGWSSAAHAGIWQCDYLRLATNAYAPTSVVALAAPVAAESPLSVTNDLGASITLSARFSGLVSTRQWYKDNAALPSATNLTYVISSATAADRGSYFLRATNAAGLTDTTPAYVEVLEYDPTLPEVQRIQGLLTLEHVRVTYTKPIIPASMTNILNYQFRGGAPSALAALRVDQYTVEVQTTPQAANANYTLVINGVLDTLTNAIAPDTSVSFTAPAVVPCVRYDAGTTTTRPAGPPDPSSADGGYWTLTTNSNNGMGVGAVMDDLSTGLNAWTVSDQNVLSTGGLLDYRMAIDPPSDSLARANGWRLLTRSRMVDDYGSSTATPTVLYSDNGTGLRYGLSFDLDLGGNLVATVLGGATYTVADSSTAQAYHTHVLIRNPGSATAAYYCDGQLIVGNYAGQANTTYDGLVFGCASPVGAGQMNYNLVELDVLNGAQPVVTLNPQSSTHGVGQKVTFTAAFSPFVGACQWLSNGVVLAGATNTSYTTDFITLDYNGAQYRCRALNALGNVETAAATLTVTPDITPPAVAAIRSSLLLDRVLITSSEPVLELYATNIANYVWSNSAVTNMTGKLIDPFTVELHTTPLQGGSNYTVLVSNVRDTSNLAIPANTPASFTTPTPTTLARYYAGSTSDAPLGPPDPTSPEGGGWTLLMGTDAGLSTNAVTDDLGTGWHAWQVRDATAAAGQFIQYLLPLNTNQDQILKQCGWALTVRGRLPEDLGTGAALFAQYRDNSFYRFLLNFDLDGSGELTVGLWGTNGYANHTVTSGYTGSDYHLHQVAYDPATASASYYVDGELVSSGWPGGYNASSTLGLFWGAAASTTMGTMNFNLVEFQTVTPPLVAVTGGPTVIQVQYRGVLEAADQLAHPTVWTPVATNITAGTNTYSISVGSQARQFFRARLAQ